MMVKHISFIFILILLSGCSYLNNNWTPSLDTICEGKEFIQTNEHGRTRTSIGTKDCIQQVYYFEYPEYKKSGYYVLNCKYVSNLKYCDDCIQTSICGSNKQDMFKIKEGYVENFTYKSDYPIYGAWEIKDIDDFRGKCIVGDCTQTNLRNVICMKEDYTIYNEVYDCEKWENPRGGYSLSEYCINGQTKLIGTTPTSFDKTKSNPCHKPTTINVYYVYNEYSGYEGYDVTWRTRWEEGIEKINNMLVQYSIHLTPTFYEYKLEDNSSIPATLFNYVGETGIGSDDTILRPADYQFTIIAGKKPIQDYGFNCDDNHKANTCSLGAVGNSIRLLDCCYDYLTLLHELGHLFGCPHTGGGDAGSLSPHLYLGDDIMSYSESSNKNDFLYECRIITWLLGQNSAK